MDGTHAITAAVTSVLTVLFSKGGPLLFQLLKIRGATRTADRGDAIALLLERVDKLEAEVKETRADLDQAQREHRDCQIEQARLRAEIQHLKERLSRAEVKG
jgi:septal ring factor EnvC (AmiA/AmiB activator)